jgi:putative membrane protein
MLARLGIRFGTALVGIAVGLILSSALLSDFSLNATAVVEATLVFWLIHIVVQVFCLRVLVRQPSVALAGLLALASTIVSLILVNVIVSGLYIHGAVTYLVATVIVWLAISVSDITARRMIRARHLER